MQLDKMLFRNPLPNLTQISIETNQLEVYQVVTRENFQQQWQQLVTHRLSFWMNLQQVWTLRLVDSCGVQQRRSHKKERRVRLFLLHIRWKKLKLCQQRWESWLTVVFSVASVVANILRINMVLDTRLKLKSRSHHKTNLSSQLRPMVSVANSN